MQAAQKQLNSSYLSFVWLTCKLKFLLELADTEKFKGLGIFATIIRLLKTLQTSRCATTYLSIFGKFLYYMYLFMSNLLEPGNDILKYRLGILLNQIMRAALILTS